jgi:Mg-chelatase subunit ChlD
VALCQQRAAIALAVDASTSMLQPGNAAQTKLELAVDAAREFLDLLRLDAGDQAAIVAFNDTATLLAGLTSDRGALGAALDAIETAQHTCLVCAVDVAATELASERHDRANTPVLILLTDGKSNPRPASEAVLRATEAKRAAILIFTIGLGTEVDDAALEAIASQPSYFYRAPTADQLGDIYHQIAVAIPCPAEGFWGRR